MIVTGEADELRALLEGTRRRGKTVGLHVAWGALHGAHRANIAKMAAECDVATLAISKSSREAGAAACEPSRPDDGLAADLAWAEEAGAGIVFLSHRFLSHNEVVGHPPAPRELGPFGAVAVAEAGLLELASPCYAYFGEKHYPRLVALRRLIEGLSLPVVLVACPTVRETDGLALSRQNACLCPSERRVAPALYWALLAGKRAVDELGERDAKAVAAKMLRRAKSQPLWELEYAHVADPLTLEPVGRISGEVRLMIAGRLGRAHLVDNVAAGTAEE